MAKVDWDLVFTAGFLTIAINFLFTYTYGPYKVPLDYAKLLIPTLMLVGFLWLLVNTYNHSKLGRVRKLRLVYLDRSITIRVYNTPNGPQVYFGTVRIHHWHVGAAAAVIGALGLLFDDDKKRTNLYRIDRSLCI